MIPVVSSQAPKGILKLATVQYPQSGCLSHIVIHVMYPHSSLVVTQNFIMIAPQCLLHLAPPRTIWWFQLQELPPLLRQSANQGLSQKPCRLVILEPCGAQLSSTSAIALANLCTSQFSRVFQHSVHPCALHYSVYPCALRYSVYPCAMRLQSAFFLASGDRPDK